MNIHEELSHYPRRWRCGRGQNVKVFKVMGKVLLRQAILYANRSCFTLDIVTDLWCVKNHPCGFFILIYFPIKILIFGILCIIDHL